MTDYIRNNKTLVVIILILLLSNGTLLFFLMKGKNNPGSKGPEGQTNNGKSGGMRAYMNRILKDSIGFDEAQLKMYDSMGNTHKEVMKPLFMTIQARKDSFYKLLMEPEAGDTIRKSYLDKIAGDQRNIDESIYRHFSELRKICKPDQTTRFDTVMQGMIKRMIAGPQRRSRK